MYQAPREFCFLATLVVDVAARRMRGCSNITQVLIMTCHLPSRETVKGCSRDTFFNLCRSREVWQLRRNMLHPQNFKNSCISPRSGIFSHTNIRALKLGSRATLTGTMANPKTSHNPHYVWKSYDTYPLYESTSFGRYPEGVSPCGIVSLI